MTAPNPVVSTGKKPKWKKILGTGCLGVVVLLVVGVLAANYYFKRAVAEHLERKMADAGFVGKVDELDYSIARRELSVRDLHAVPSGTVLANLGEVNIAEGTIQFDPDGSKEIAEVKIRGVESAMGSANKILIHPGKSFSAKGVSLKNAKEFGGGNLLKITELQVEYGVKGLGLVKVKVAELTAVKNKKGQWNLLVKPVKELKFRDKKIERIGEFHLEVETVKVLDLSREGESRIVPVKKTIRVRNINSAADFNSKILPKLQALLGEVKSQP
jgi:hypothetical protein